MISGIGNFPGNEVVIWNRWGNEVFRTLDYQNDWGGTNSNTGEALPDGTYFYLITLPEGNQEIRGFITVYR